MGLTFAKTRLSSSSFNEELILDLLISFRDNVRRLALQEQDFLKDEKKQLLIFCDDIRNTLIRYGIKLKVRVTSKVAFLMLKLHILCFYFRTLLRQHLKVKKCM